MSNFPTIDNIDVPAETFEKLESWRQFVVADRRGQQFICRLSIIDLDPKSFDKIPFYLQEDMDVIDHYTDVVNKRVELNWSNY